MAVARGPGEQGGESVFNGYGVSVSQDEKVLGMESGEGGTM